ncbi:MAG: hypothetical protein P1V35_11970 [Planctomycetota bacterium]|nr:hypothetical protein [Planctomycetota bacterium]
MNRFRTSTHRQQVCHELKLPEVLRRRRESVSRTRKKTRGRGASTPFTDIPEAVAPQAAVPAPASPRPVPQAKPASDATREAIDLLERRLLKLAGALESQESLLLEMRQGPVEDTGLASTFRSVQGLQDGESELKRKQELMERIFKSNQELRERITSPGDLAE